MGYSWFNDSPAKFLKTDFPAWSKKWGVKKE
jgi:hypothetical protein